MIGGIKNSDFARSRAETFRGLPSCFCESVTRRPVTTVFLAKSKGGSFLKSWTLSIATSVSEKKHCVFHKTWMSFFERFHFYMRREGPQVMCTPSSMAIRPNDRKWFFRLHNFNSNSDYYLNSMDESKLIYNHGQKSWDTFAFMGRFPIHTGPTPPLTLQTMLDACIQNFFRVSTLYRWGGRTARKFRKECAVSGWAPGCFKRKPRNDRKIWISQYCPRDVCPELYR